MRIYDHAPKLYEYYRAASFRFMADILKSGNYDCFQFYTHKRPAEFIEGHVHYNYFKKSLEARGIKVAISVYPTMGRRDGRHMVWVMLAHVIDNEGQLKYLPTMDSFL
jgi:hypothetical protein